MLWAFWGKCGLVGVFVFLMLFCWWVGVVRFGGVVWSVSVVFRRLVFDVGCDVRVCIVIWGCVVLVCWWIFPRFDVGFLDCFRYWPCRFLCMCLCWLVVLGGVFLGWLCVHGRFVVDGFFGLWVCCFCV